MGGVRQSAIAAGKEIEEVAAFGARLKQERERRNITLEDVAASTKIGTRMLRALEDEHFDQLPGGIFNRGFVRAYARHLGIDENQAIADYLVASGENLPAKNLEVLPPTDAPASDDSSADVRIPWGIIALVLVILVLAFATWGFYIRQKSASVASSPPPSINHSNQAGHANEAVATTPIQQTSSSPPPVPRQTAALPVASAQNDVSTTLPSPGSFVVLVKAREESWVRITADGKEIMTDTLTAAAEKSIEARNRVVVRAGNTGALDFFFNGKKLPPQGGYDEVKTLTFDPNGLQPPPNPEPVPQLPPTQP